MGSKKTTETKSNRDPWKPAQGFLKDTMGEAKRLFNSNVGKDYFKGSGVVGFNGDSREAHNRLRNRAMNGSAISNAGQEQYSKTLGGGMFNRNPANDMYRSIEGGSPAVRDNLSGMASGEEIGNNPYLDKKFDHISSKISDSVGGMFSKAGRYGSGAHQGALTENLGNVANNLYGNAYNADRSRQMQANQMLDTADRNDTREKFMTADRISNDYNSERGYQNNAMMNAPVYANNDYNDISRLAGLGGVGEGKDRQHLQDKMNRWNFNRTNPYNRLQQYQNSAMMFGNMGGQNNSKTTQQTSGLGSMMGNIMGGIGALGKTGIFGGAPQAMGGGGGSPLMGDQINNLSKPMNFGSPWG